MRGNDLVCETLCSVHVCDHVRVFVLPSEALIPFPPVRST
jgi:hypothetical protein